MTHTTSTAADRASEQRMLALERANHIRLQRAAVKRHLAEPGDRGQSYARAAALLTRPEPAVAHAIAGMPLRALVGACHRAGALTTDKLLTRAHIPLNKTIGQLTDRQRDEICRLLIGDASAPTLWETIENPWVTGWA
jgi:hypothetical protein